MPPAWQKHGPKMLAETRLSRAHHRTGGGKSRPGLEGPNTFPGGLGGQGNLGNLQRNSFIVTVHMADMNKALSGFVGQVCPWVCTGP